MTLRHTAYCGLLAIALCVALPSRPAAAQPDMAPRKPSNDETSFVVQLASSGTVGLARAMVLKEALHPADEPGDDTGGGHRFGNNGAAFGWDLELWVGRRLGSRAKSVNLVVGGSLRIGQRAFPQPVAEMRLTETAWALGPKIELSNHSGGGVYADVFIGVTGFGACMGPGARTGVGYRMRARGAFGVGLEVAGTWHRGGEDGDFNHYTYDDVMIGLNAVLSLRDE